MPFNAFTFPDWLIEEARRRPQVDWQAELRVQELRNSIAMSIALHDDAPLRRGATITVRRPRRFVERSQ